MQAPGSSFSLCRNAGRKAFTIVTVLIILTLLAVISVGFLASMTAERTTSVAFANKSKADQAAQAGVDNAMATLRQCFKSFPDSCTVWDPQQSSNDAASTNGGKYNGGTSLYFRGRTPTPDDTTDNRPQMLTTGADPVTNQPISIYVLPLTSGVGSGAAVLEKNKSSALPVMSTKETDVTKQNAVDLNAKRSQTDTEGWVGSPPNRPDKTVPTPIWVPWVEVKDASGAVNSRYAYWVEDESFKANVNYASIGDPSALHKRRDNKTNPAAADPLGYISARDADLQGLLAAVADADPQTASKAIFDLRNTYPTALFPEARGYSHTPGLSDQSNALLRFVTTTTSGGLNLSRHGSQRLNLNATVPTATSPSDTKTIKKQLDRIVQTIRFHAPNFGQRFYRPSTDVSPATLNDLSKSPPKSVSDDHALIYMYKVAANIRDAIDSDSSPTYVMAGGDVLPQGKLQVWPQDPFWAIGKDSAPFLSEGGVRFTGSVSGGKYILNVDYYIELWNLTSKDVKASDIGNNGIIRISYPTKWVGSNKSAVTINKVNYSAYQLNETLPANGVSPSASRDSAKTRDFEFSIGQSYSSDGSTSTPVIFPAGSATVLTTDAPFNHTSAGVFASQDCTVAEGNLSLADASRYAPITDTDALGHVVRCKWVGNGTSTYTGAMPANCDIIKMQFVDTASSDYETDTVIQTDNGPVDGSATAIPINAIGTNTTYLNYSGGGNQPPVFGGYLRGNWTATSNADAEGVAASSTGDPRTNNEQLEYNSSTVAAEFTRFKNWDVASKSTAPFPPLSHPYTEKKGVIPTLGLPNYLSARPNRVANPWMDYAPVFSTDPKNPPAAADLQMSASKALAVVPDAPLSSIAQLGDVYDPARIINGTAATSVTSSHGGGRTFKIGQHDDRWDGDETKESRTWTSWRLLDFFCIADHADQPRLIDQYGIEQPGLININGVARDGGAALRAALTGLIYQPTPYGDAAFASGTVPNFDKLVEQMTTRVTTPITDQATQTVNTGTNLTGAGPFWERGEMSELPLFGRSMSASIPAAGTVTTDLTGIDMSSKVFDRGREELFRRIAEMITTRGDTFTVYAIGQSVFQKTANGVKTYSAAQRLKVTFRLAPMGPPDATTGISPPFHPGTDAKGKTIDFDASADGNLDQRLKDRFDKPDHYDIQVLASSSGA